MFRRIPDASQHGTLGIVRFPNASDIGQYTATQKIRVDEEGSDASGIVLPVDSGNPSVRVRILVDRFGFETASQLPGHLL